MGNIDLAKLLGTAAGAAILYMAVWVLKDNPMWILEPARWLYRGWRI